MKLLSYSDSMLYELDVLKMSPLHDRAQMAMEKGKFSYACGTRYIYYLTIIGRIIVFGYRLKCRRIQPQSKLLRPSPFKNCESYYSLSV